MRHVPKWRDLTLTCKCALDLRPLIDRELAFARLLRPSALLCEIRVRAATQTSRAAASEE
jgi:hypothetical protein